MTQLLVNNFLIKKFKKKRDFLKASPPSKGVEKLVDVL